MLRNRLVQVKELFKKPRFIFGIISFFLILLRLIPITFGDIYGDNALNSFRAYGWFDWIGSGVQTTPFLWLGFAPFWSLLSFHDAPPLAFLLQNIFFNFFGNGAFALRLPFVLAGIGSVALTFFVIRKFTSSFTASVAAILYSFISYGVWAGHAAYLEGIEEFFIVGSILFGAIYLFKGQNYKYLYAWSAFTAAALLTKYTAVFLLPGIIAYLFLYRNSLRPHLKQIIISAVLFVLLLSPVIIYNIKTYQLRGHFDAALSSMVGIKSDDFGQIKGREIALSQSGLDYTVVANTLRENVSPPLVVLITFCLIIALWKLYRNGFRNFEAWIFINFLFLLILFTIGTNGTRFLSITVPFLVMLVAFGVAFVVQKFNGDKLRYSIIGLVAAIFVFEFVYSLNTNFLANPVGSPKWLYSENKIKNFGFNQLDSYLRKNALTNLPKKVSIKKTSDIGFSNENVRGRSIIVYDDRINWFSRMWYMEKYLFFHKLPVISSSALIPGWTGYVDVNRLMGVTGENTYFIFPISESVMDPVRVADDAMNYVGPSMAQDLDQSSIPFEIINNGEGAPVFKVYIIPALQ